VFNGSELVTMLFGIDGMRVLAQAEIVDEWWLKIETTADLVGCGACGTRAVGHGRRTVRVRLDELFKRLGTGEVKELNIVLKADVLGSAEAICQSLERLSTPEVKVNIIHNGVGAISETDIMLAAASNAIVIGFNVRPDANARRAADSEHVDIRLYRIIYEAIDDVKAAMSGLLTPVFKEVVVGRAEIRQVFKVPKAGTVAGSYVSEGKINNKNPRLLGMHGCLL
jgi:translation initiation factor IF-2